MNRKHRRAVAAQERRQEHQKLVDETLEKQDEFVAGCKWISEPDPDDSRFALISMRVPWSDCPPQELHGEAASRRLAEFLLAFGRGIALATQELQKREQPEPGKIIIPS